MPNSGETRSHEEVEMNTLAAESHARSRSRIPNRSHGSKARKLQGEQQLHKRDYAIGIGLLLIVVFLWTSSNFITQDMYEGGYAKPFLVTYLNTASFSLYLVPFLMRKAWRKYRGSSDASVSERVESEYERLMPDERRHSNEYEPLDADEGQLAGSELPPLTTEDTVKLAFMFCFFWFVANWAVNASLDYTTVASATILSSMSGFFTLGLGALFRVEKFSFAKVVAVLISFSGVLLVSLSDSSASQLSMRSLTSHKVVPATTDVGSQPVLGDCLALLSAVFYALYVILLKVRIKAESRIDMQLFFGFVGLFSILACWPIGFVLHFLGLEKFELPSTRGAVAAILINMFITLSSDFIYVLSMLKTTPLVVTIGLSLTIPLAVIGDAFLGRPAAAKVIAGAILVLIGFVAVGWENSKPENSNPDVEGAPEVERGRSRSSPSRTEEEERT